MHAFLDGYAYYGWVSVAVVACLYLLFVGIMLVRYLQGVYRGKWELENCGGVAFNLLKGMALGFFLALIASAGCFFLYPIVVVVIFVSSLHPDFRRRVGERFVHMNKKSAVRYIFAAIPIIIFVLFLELVECADEVLDDDVK